MNKQKMQEYRELAAYAINTTLLAHYGRAIMHLLSELDTKQADNADLRRQVRDLEELLRREEARA